MNKFNRNTPLSETHRPLWDWFAAILLLFALYSTSRRLVITEWTEHLRLIYLVTFFAALIGMALGLSRFNKRKVFLIGLGYASLFIPWQLGRTLSPGVLWAERLSSLLGRLISSFENIFEKQTSSDPLLFLFTISILFWLTSISAGFGLTRKANPWLMIVPAGIVIVIIQTYDPYGLVKIWSVAEFLFFSMLLIARVHFLKKERIWTIENTRVPLYAALNMLPITLGIIIIFILAAWGTPALADALDPAERAWQKLTEPWKEIREDFGRAFNSLKTSVAGISDIYGSSLSLGRGSIKSETLILEIETPIRISPFIRFYWRSRTYDYYDPLDLGWESSDTKSREFLPEEQSFYENNYQDRWESSFNVTVFKPLTVLFITQEPIWLSRPSNIFINPINDEAQDDIIFFRADSPLFSGDEYQFKAQISNSNIFNLMAAGTDYPDWVLEKYLQIPDTITERTRALAESISDGLETPYEIGEAITQYLRDNIEYTEVIPPLPEGQDPIDWILFDLKQGFCNYYATAEIMMLRSLGIPARLAVGYSHGELFYDLADEEGVYAKPSDEQIDGALDEESFSSERYLVRHSDLHAWPEVFFPGIGWVEFEPTLNQAPLERSAGGPAILISEIGEDQNDDSPIEEDAEEEVSPPNIEPIEEGTILNDLPTNNTSFYITTTLGLIALLLILYVNKLKRSHSNLLRPIPILLEKSFLRLNITPPKMISNLSYLAQLSTLDRSYLEINKALRRLGHPVGLEATPAERAEALQGLMPSLDKAVSLLLDQYQIGEYSLGEANLVIAIKTSREIRSQSLKVWYQKIIFNIKYFWKKDRDWKIE